MITIDRNTAPASNPINTVHFIEPIRKQLDNNIEVILLSGGDQEVLKIDFVFNAGIWYQTKNLVASSTNKLMQEGTKNYSAAEIAEGIDQYGAFLQTECSFDTATITLYTLSKYLDKVLPFLQEIILYPAFSEKEFTTYQHNALEKFRVNMEKVSFVAKKEFAQNVFEDNNPYGTNPSINDYELLSPDLIKKFHSTQYSLDNCHIVIAGKVDSNVLPTLNHFFGNTNITTNNGFIQNTNDEKNTSPQQIYIEKEGALQSAIRIGRLMPNRLHEDYLGLQVLNTVLGGYFGSRLMSNIREDKGYTYGIGSGIVSLINGGYFFISTEVGSNVTKAALKEIYKEIEKLRTEKITPDELDLVKNYMMGHFLKSCDGPLKMAILYEQIHPYGLTYDHFHQYIQTIKDMDAVTLQELANKYLNQQDLREVVVGEQ